MLFILFFCLLISALVFTISYLFSPEEAYFFGIFALLLAFLGSFFSYYYSDTILLKMANAHPVVKEEEPYLYHTIEGVAIAADIPHLKLILLNGVPNALLREETPITRQSLLRDFWN